MTHKSLLFSSVVVQPGITFDVDKTYSHHKEYKRKPVNWTFSIIKSTDLNQMLADYGWKFTFVPTLPYYTTLSTHCDVSVFSRASSVARHKKCPSWVIKWQIIFSFSGFCSEYTSQTLLFRSPTLNTHKSTVIPRWQGYEISAKKKKKK